MTINFDRNAADSLATSSHIHKYYTFHTWLFNFNYFRTHVTQSHGAEWSSKNSETLHTVHINWLRLTTVSDYPVRNSELDGYCQILADFTLKIAYAMACPKGEKRELIPCRFQTGEGWLCK